MVDSGGVAEQARLVLARARIGKGGLIVERLPPMDEIDEQADDPARVGKAQQIDRAAGPSLFDDGGNKAAKGGIVPGIVGMTPAVKRGHFRQPGRNFVSACPRDMGQAAAMILDRAADLAARIGAEQREIVARHAAHPVQIDLIDRRGVDPALRPAGHVQQRRIRRDPAQPQRAPVTTAAQRGDGGGRGLRLPPARGKQAIIFDIGPVGLPIARLVEAQRRRASQQARHHCVTDQRQRDICA